jgi:hypothetical protein
VSTAISSLDQLSAKIETVLVGGDLSKLTAEERLSYYKAVCQSVGLNPLTKPFEYITLNGKLTLYARKDCTDQLRTLHGVSITLPSRELIDGIYVVTAHAKNSNGRTDESTGAVHIDGLKGENKANAYMKAESKAKRRVTLSICGLGLLDETEIESIPDAKPFKEAKAAQQAVLEKKLNEYPSTLPGKVVPEAVQQLFDVLGEKGMIFDIAKAFKKSLGEVEYYKVLDEHGCKHITDAKKVIKAKEIILGWWEREQDMKALDLPSFEIEDSDIPS